MSQLQQQLRDSIRELEQIRKIKAYTSELQLRLAEEEKALEVMELMLAKEQRDVEQLEKEGLTAMFRKFIGDREEKLEKEREEYLRAALRYNELFKSVGLIRYELDLLLKKEQNLEAVERRLEALIHDRGKELLDMDAQAGRDLKALYQRMDQLQASEVEMEEAFQAGMKALENLQETERSLQVARERGQHDMWGGRRLGSGDLKHSAIDQARQSAQHARHTLIRFVKEMRDIYKDREYHFEFRIEEFGRFMDVFFDNLISDWLVQQKINTSLMSVSTTRQQVEAVIFQLDQDRKEIKNKLDALEEEEKRIILQS